MTMTMSFGHRTAHRGKAHLHSSLGDNGLSCLESGSNLNALTVIPAY